MSSTWAYAVALVGIAFALGFALRWWALLLPPLAAFGLAYAWEWYGPAVAYAVIAGALLVLGAAAGSLLRSRLRRRA